jgi:probable rRNA maturation factor
MYHVIIQYAVDKTLAPRASLLRKWAKTSLRRKISEAEVTIRMVTLEEMIELNETYRQKKGPTNVLSFPFDVPSHIELEIPILGDIVICPDVVTREATEQSKPQEAHFAHMVVHGVFHLLGYDHQLDSEALVMETLERDVMQELGFPDPYLTGEGIEDNG